MKHIGSPQVVELNGAEPLTHYRPIRYLADLLAGCLYLKQIRLFKDDKEGTFNAADQEALWAESRKLLRSFGMYDEQQDLFARLWFRERDAWSSRQFAYAMCFRRSAEECRRAWDEYCAAGGVMISTTVWRVHSSTAGSLPRPTICSVGYLDHSSQSVLGRPGGIFFHKDAEEFAWEREMRLLAYVAPPLVKADGTTVYINHALRGAAPGQAGTQELEKLLKSRFVCAVTDPPDHVSIPVDTSQLIESISLPPLAGR